MSTCFGDFCQLPVWNNFQVSGFEPQQFVENSGKKVGPKEDFWNRMIAEDG